MIVYEKPYCLVRAKCTRDEWVAALDVDPFFIAERRRDRLIEAEYIKIVEATGESLDEIREGTEIIGPMRDPVQYANMVTASAFVSYWAGEEVVEGAVYPEPATRKRWWVPDDIQPSPPLED